MSGGSHISDGSSRKFADAIELEISYETRFSLRSAISGTSLLAVLTVVATTIPLVLIGRDTLGEAVIAMLYLVPVTWSANRWGQLPGISAALTAALAFDFLFIPPFYTFAVARLEGWLVLAIFLGVAIVVVERIQASLSQAREAVFMYEMSAAICGQRTPRSGCLCRCQANPTIIPGHAGYSDI